MPGDEVITCAAGFPTTVAPMIQNGAVPVFLDNDPVTGNCPIAITGRGLCPRQNQSRDVAHTLGNPFNSPAVLDFCEQHDLWLIEDNCDALGSTYTRMVRSEEETRS